MKTLMLIAATPLSGASSVPVPGSENPATAAALALAFSILGLLLLAIGIVALWWGLTTVVTGWGILEALVAILGLCTAISGSFWGSLGGLMALRVYRRHPAYRSSPKVIAALMMGGLCLLPLLGGLSWWLYEEVLR